MCIYNFPGCHQRAQSPLGLFLPGNCLPLLFHKSRAAYRFLEASNPVAGGSASHNRVGAHQRSESERSIARRFLVPAKNFETHKPFLARASDVAIGFLSVRGASKHARGEGGQKQAIYYHPAISQAPVISDERGSAGRSS
jgi:hypothetical protein